MSDTPEKTPFARFVERHNFINSPFNRGSRAVLRGTGHLAAAMFGGLLGIKESLVGHDPGSMISGTGYHGMSYLRQGLGIAGKAFGQGLGVATLGVVKGIRGYRGARTEAASRMQRLRDIADSLETPTGPSSRRVKIQEKYGRVWDEKTQKYGARRFGARSPKEHLKKAVHNLRDPKWGPLGVFGFGMNVAAAAMMSSDDLFDMQNGLARNLASNVAFEVGGLAGAGLGAAALTAAFPVAGLAGAAIAGVGVLAGFFLGGAAAAGALDLAFWGRSEFGHRHGRGAEARKSSLVDSEYASTMRQRALQTVYRSQLNARSAFGQEALALHG